jgi:hypothetical protein
MAHVQCGDYSGTLNFYVVPGDVGIILGYEWLMNLDPVIEWKNKRIFIKYKGSLLELPSQF